MLHKDIIIVPNFLRINKPFEPDLFFHISLEVNWNSSPGKGMASSTFTGKTFVKEQHLTDNKLSSPIPPQPLQGGFLWGPVSQLLFSHTLSLVLWTATRCRHLCLQPHLLPRPLTWTSSCVMDISTSPPDIPQAPYLQWVPDWTWHLLSCVSVSVYGETNHSITQAWHVRARIWLFHFPHTHITRSSHKDHPFFSNCINWSASRESQPGLWPWVSAFCSFEANWSGFHTLRLKPKVPASCYRAWENGLRIHSATQAAWACT